MRFTLLFILATAVAARRGASPTQSTDCKRYIKNHEYPFGWGLDDEICVDEMNCPVPCVQAQKVKEVNRGTVGSLMLVNVMWS